MLVIIVLFDLYEPYQIQLQHSEEMLFLHLFCNPHLIHLEISV